MFRGWSRFRLQAASVPVMEGASPTPGALVKTAQADVMEEAANVATEQPDPSAEAVADGGEMKRETARRSILVAELELKLKDTEQVLQKQNLRRMKILVRVDACMGDFVPMSSWIIKRCRKAWRAHHARFFGPLTFPRHIPRPGFVYTVQDHPRVQ